MYKKLSLLPLLFFCVNALASEMPYSKEDLVEQFVQAHNQRDYDSISKMINWDGVSRYKQKIVRVYTKANFGRPVVKTELQEADTNFLKKFSVGSKKYKSNIEVSHLMRLYFDSSSSSPETEYDSVVYMVGEINGEYKISIAINDNGDVSESTH